MLTIPKSYYLAFKKVQNLEEYFEGRLDFGSHAELSNLLEQILIVTLHNSDSNSVQWQTAQLYDEKKPPELPTLLSKIGSFLFTMEGCQNVLISNCVAGVRDVSVKFARTAIEEFQTKKAWSLIYRSIGPYAFCKLVLDHVILIGLPNDTFYQLSGYPINKLDVVSRTILPQKREHEEIQQVINTRQCITFTQPHIPRRQKKRKKELESKEKSGLVGEEEKKHVEQTIDRFICYTSLNTQHLGSSLPKNHILKGKYKERKDYVQKFLSNMFPKEFSSSKKKKKFFKRCLPITKIAEKIYKMYNGSSVMHRLNSICPEKNIDKDIKSMSHSYGQVSFFLKEQLKKSTPLEFWGSRHNFNVVCRAIEHFVNRTKIEQLHMQEVLHQFKIKDCQWLSPASGKASFLVPTDLEKRKEILMQAVRWIFHNFISVLIRSFFCVTECATNRSELCYFRKDVWYHITRPFIATTMNNYQMIHVDNIRHLKLGISGVRIIPKGRGFRMITNLRNATNSRQSSKYLANKKLKPILQILNFEKEQRPEMVGSSVLSHQLFEKLKGYKNKIKRVDFGERLYFVKIDISSCFDSLNQDTLMQLLKANLTSDKYIHRYADVLNLFTNGARNEIAHMTGSTERMKSLADHAKTLGSSNSGAIVVDRNRSYSRNLTEIMDLLEESIKKNVVQIGNSYYQRKKGIPQGSCLSTILCDFFFGAFENSQLAFLKGNENGLLLRYIDDFLYISPQKYYPQKFLKTMTLELPKLGINVNQDKCLSNLEDDIEEFPWLGYLFNTKNLDVHIDISNSTYKDLQSSSYINYSMQPGKALFASQIKSIKHKIQDILVDSRFNSKGSIIRNLNDNFYITAKRLEIQITKLSESAHGFFNLNFLLDVIVQVGNYVTTIIPSTLKKKEVLTNYFLIYQLVFKKKNKYKELLYYLDNAIQLVAINKNLC